MRRWPTLYPIDRLPLKSLGAILLPLILPLGLLRCDISPDQPAWIDALGYTSRQVFPIALDQFGGPVVPVFVNGHPAPLTFDTGNMTGLLLSPAFAASTGLRITGQRDLYDSEGRPSRISRVYQVDSLEVFGEVWTKLDAAEYASDNLTGFLGPHYLLGKRFTIDYPNLLMAVSGSDAPAAFHNGVVLPLIRSPRFEGLLLVEGQINGQPVLMELDTGKSRSCVDPELADRLELAAVNHGYRVDELRLRDYVFSIRSAKEVGFGALGDGLDQPVLASIGADVLSQLRITVDYKAGRIILER